MRPVHKGVMTLMALWLGVAATPASAQVAAVQMEVAYPGVVVDSGQQASFDLRLTGTPGVASALHVEGLPAEWSAQFKGGGAAVDAAMVSGNPDVPTTVTLDVDVPGDAEEGTYEFTALAGSFSLPLSITVKAGVAGSITLTPDFPALRGPSDADFAFNVDVANETDSTVEVTLAATGPGGWTVTAEPTTQAKAAVISIDAGQSSRVSLKATPSDGAEAGSYEVGMAVTGEGIDESLTVGIELVGELSLTITTPDQRLNADVSLGGPTDVPVVVVNDGTAALSNVVVTATPPTDWDVTFAPESIPTLAPGESATVTASLTPSDGAIAGDYDVTFSASSDSASDSMDIRTTVTPSAAGGLVGVGLIALTLAGLSLVFRRFGRR